ncbi:hypothetical protein KNP65_03830 [Latilactobacillus curvatus]|uniref:hypothetical protein n=1 Tax=Latilactobacillus curvatus TaxID=28038 RepID=UPI002410C0B2|nr:hypothetical protein [Latilactobacillus curvatus]MDG2979068.1 hypothetical protein [Latilactobacillus curvatus]
MASMLIKKQKSGIHVRGDKSFAPVPVLVIFDKNRGTNRLKMVLLLGELKKINNKLNETGIKERHLQLILFVFENTMMTSIIKKVVIRKSFSMNNIRPTAVKPKAPMSRIRT